MLLEFYNTPYNSALNFLISFLNFLVIIFLTIASANNTKINSVFRILANVNLPFCHTQYFPSL